MAGVQRWFLHSGGSADARPSDGTLSTVAATMEPVDSLNCGTSADALGDGAHGLRYTTPVFIAPLAIDGPVALDLYVASSSGVEFTAMIVDHGPDRRDNFVGSAAASPADGTALTLDFGAIAHTVAVGHRLHLDITATSHEGLAAFQVAHDAVHPSALLLTVD